MYTTVTTLAALVASVLVSSAQGVAAQANPPPNRREQPESDRQENERRRKAESRDEGQIADITEARFRRTSTFRTSPLLPRRRHMSCQC